MKRVGWRINLSAAPEFGNTKEKIPLNTNRYILVSMASTSAQISIRLPARLHQLPNNMSRIVAIGISGNSFLRRPGIRYSGAIVAQDVLEKLEYGGTICNNWWNDMQQLVERYATTGGTIYNNFMIEDMLHA